jgi:hypothetical protein
MFDINDTDKSQPERLRDDASFDERFAKFASIVIALKSHSIYLTDRDNGNPVLEDKACGFKLTHNLITWEVFKVEEVVDMIVSSRDEHVARKKVS